MTALETLLVLAGGPLVILGVLAVLTLWPKFARSPRYHPAQDWDHPPVWWTARPDVVGVARPPASRETIARTARGGASGNW